MKKKITKLTRLFLSITMMVSNFTIMIPLVKADLVNLGDIKNSINSVGSVSNQGDVQVTRTVTADNINEGILNVSLAVQGKNVSTSAIKNESFDTSVVIDRSASMADDCEDANILGVCFSSPKWMAAFYGTKTLATNLITAIPQMNLQLISFGTGITERRSFQNQDFSAVSNFGAWEGSLSSLASAIESATNSLNTRNANNKTIVIVTDGEPYSESATRNAITTAKNNNIEIFVVGISPTTTAANFLQEISSGSNYYSSNDFTPIKNKLIQNATIYGEKYAGTNATITDSIADGFTYVDNSANPSSAIINGNDITFNLGDITETIKTVSYKIKIIKTLADSWYETNNSALMSYTNSNNQAVQATISTSAEFYWQTPAVSYLVNYYQDSLNGNLLGSDNTNTALLGSSSASANINLNAFKPTGYKNGTVASASYIFGENNNIINVVYEKKTDLAYEVEYYQDNVKTNTDSFGNQVFNTVIKLEDIFANKYKPAGYKDGEVTTTMPYTIIDGSNIIQVNYEKRNDIPYIINYYQDNVSSTNLIESVTKTDTFGKSITVTTNYKVPVGYEFTGIIPTLVLTDELNNQVDIIYTKRSDLSYVVQYYLNGIIASNLTDVFNNQT